MVENLTTIHLSLGGNMGSNTVKKVHKLIFRKQLEVSNGMDNILVPLDYVVQAKTLCYQRHGKEMIDMVVLEDGKLFKEEAMFNQVLCDNVRYYEE
jgi:hypothetical protein